MKDDQSIHDENVPSSGFHSNHDVEDISSDEEEDLIKSGFDSENAKLQEEQPSKLEEKKSSDLKGIDLSEVPEIPEELTDAQHKNLQRRLDLLDMRMAVVNKIEANKLLKMQQAMVKKAQENQDLAFKNQKTLEKLLAKGISLV